MDKQTIIGNYIVPSSKEHYGLVTYIYIFKKTQNEKDANANPNHLVEYGKNPKKSKQF